MQIRLFTSGVHNGLSFSNADIDSIATKTTAEGREQIPLVLGHPKNDLPVVGFLPKAAITTYKEGDKVSLGFSREAAELDEESLNVIRNLGRNKISVRLEDGKIKHIGLVERAAVAENNQQDFAAGTGDFAAVDEFYNVDPPENAWNLIRNLFNNKTKGQMPTEEEKQDAEFSALKKDVEGISTKVDTLVAMFATKANEKKKESLTIDFSAAGYSHLTDEQRKKAVDFCGKLETPEEVADYKAMLIAGNKKPGKPKDGSVTADFAWKDGDERTAIELIREQVAGLVK